MKKIFLLLFFSTFLYATINFDNLTLAYTDKSGKVYTGKVVSYEDGKKSIFSIKKGNLNGPYKMYHKNGKLAVNSYYKNGILEGKFEKFHENGKLSLKANYKNGLLEGLYEEYYENGKLAVKSYYKNGLSEGPYVGYYENGSILVKSNYKEEQLDGPYEYYDEKGFLKTKAIYKNDEIVSEEHFYNDDIEEILYLVQEEYMVGLLKLFEQIEYLETLTNLDKLNEEFAGELNIKYLINQDKTNFEISKNNKKMFDFKLTKDDNLDLFIETDKIGKLDVHEKLDKKTGILTLYKKDKKFVLNFNEFGLNGIQKIYNASGVLVKEYETKNGYLHGVYKEYDETGKLINTEKYVNGELIK